MSWHGEKEIPSQRRLYFLRGAALLAEG